MGGCSIEVGIHAKHMVHCIIITLAQYESWKGLDRFLWLVVTSELRI